MLSRMLALSSLVVTLLIACSHTTPERDMTPEVMPTGANTASAIVELVPTAEPTIPPPREEGLASVGGVLYTIYGHAPIPGTVFYLTPAAGENQDRPPVALSGAHADKGDVRGTSGESGGFAFDAVPPGRYFLVVWAPYNWILAVESETDDTPRLIEVEAGQRLDLGRVDVPWP